MNYLSPIQKNTLYKNNRDNAILRSMVEYSVYDESKI